MKELLKSFTADQCRMLDNLGVHVELTKTNSIEAPCKIYMYCTQADSIDNLLEKGKVVGEYIIQKSFYCNKNNALSRVLSSIAGLSVTNMDFSSSPVTFFVCGSVKFYDNPEELSCFRNLKGEKILRAPLKFQFCCKE